MDRNRCFFSFFRITLVHTLYIILRNVNCPTREHILVYDLETGGHYAELKAAPVPSPGLWQQLVRSCPAPNQEQGENLVKAKPQVYPAPTCPPSLAFPGPHHSYQAAFLVGRPAASTNPSDLCSYFLFLIEGSEGEGERLARSRDPDLVCENLGRTAHRSCPSTAYLPG